MALSRHPGSSSDARPFHSGETGTPTYLSLPAPNDGLTRRPSPRARPAFTRPCRSFWSAFAELIRGQTPPDDFCNLLSSTCGQPNLGPLSSQGRWPRPPSFSDAGTPSPRGAVLRGEPRDVRFRRPRCWFLLLAQFAQPRCLRERSPRAPHVNVGPPWGRDVHGPPDRVKDASRDRGDDLSCLEPGAHAWRA
jgi:hypothetical protein